MIRLPTDNAIRSVNLLTENHPHQLMWERHIRKADTLIGSFQYRRMKPQRPAYHKHNMAFPVDSSLLQHPCKAFRSIFLSKYLLIISGIHHNTLGVLVNRVPVKFFFDFAYTDN